MMNRQISNKLIAILIILLVSCRSVSSDNKQVNADDKYVENEMLCQISREKSHSIGKEFTVFGTYVTDFLHGAMINARCENGESRGLVIGFISKTERNLLIEKQWNDRHCSGHFSCARMSIPVTFRGKLKEYDDGIYFDVDEIVVDE